MEFLEAVMNNKAAGGIVLVALALLLGFIASKGYDKYFNQSPDPQPTNPNNTNVMEVDATTADADHKSETGTSDDGPSVGGTTALNTNKADSFDEIMKTMQEQSPGCSSSEGGYKEMCILDEDHDHMDFGTTQPTKDVWKNLLHGGGSKRPVDVTGTVSNITEPVVDTNTTGNYFMDIVSESPGAVSVGIWVLAFLVLGKCWCRGRTNSNKYSDRPIQSVAELFEFHSDCQCLEILQCTGHAGSAPSSSSAPSTHAWKNYHCLTKKDLVLIAKKIGVPGNLANMNKATALDEVTSHYEVVLNGLTVPDLKEMLLIKGVFGTAGMKKQDLVRLALDAGF